MRPYDCIIVGGGPAGLSAALLLGRCRRRVLLCDAGEPRNRWSDTVHGFFSRDGVAPLELLRIGREQLRPYRTVEVVDTTVLDTQRVDGGFAVVLPDGVRHHCRKLLLATGVVDDIPPIAGLDALYGSSVHHCPYCDGWEHRDQTIAVYGRGDAVWELALALTVWTDDLMLCTGGPSGFDDTQRRELDRLGIGLREEPIARLDGRDGRLQSVVFERGAPAACQALFFATGQRQACDLAAKLGCRFTEKGAVATGTCEATDVPGLFVAGDASKASQLVAVAAAEGTQAGFAINRDLLREDLRARLREAAASPA